MYNNIAGIKIHCASSIPNKSLQESKTVLPCQLIETGQLLLSVTKNEVSPEVTLKAGRYTEMSTEGSEVVSCCYGYPRITVTKAEDTSTLCVSLIPLVEVSEDRMEAKLNLFPPTDKAFPSAEMILMVLEKQGVVYGIDHQAIENALDKVRKDGQPKLDYLIAQGKAPNDGKDAYIRFEVEIGPLPGKLLADGSIDFRERLMFVGVKKGQLLASKIPATKGYPGMNLLGEVSDATDGNDIAVKVSEDTQFFEHDGTIRATASGVLSVVGDNTIRVSSKQKITGDINFATGNIQSFSCVEISGSVQPGFIIFAKGNVSISGTIQSASVSSHGNIVIKGGIIGKQSMVNVRGDADIHHIEKGHLAAGENIVIRAGAYYSVIQAGGNIHCPDNVKIIGGDLAAGGSLSCGQIGSPTAELMSIAVGVDPHRYKRYQELQQEYLEILQESQNWYNRHGRRQKMPQVVQELETKMRAIEHELSILNLIPGTPEDSLGDRMFCYTQASITVHSSITSGNSVRIGNEIMVLEHDLDGCIIKMDKNSGEITIDIL